MVIAYLLFICVVVASSFCESESVSVWQDEKAGKGVRKMCEDALNYHPSSKPANIVFIHVRIYICQAYFSVKTGSHNLTNIRGLDEALSFKLHCSLTYYSNNTFV